jgi:hypothetical protein
LAVELKLNKYFVVLGVLGLNIIVFDGISDFLWILMDELVLEVYIDLGFEGYETKKSSIISRLCKNPQKPTLVPHSIP